MIVAVGALGAVALLGFLSLAVILAQVVALVLLGFTPVALIVGIFPGAGHAFFRAWLTKLATAIFIKALYSLVIAIVVAVSAALTASTGALGFLFAFGLQTIFFWAIFLYRKQITNRLVGATVGSADAPSPPRASVVQKGAQAATKPFTALASVSRPGSSRHDSALAVAGTQGGSSTAPEPPGSPEAPSSTAGDRPSSPATNDGPAPSLASSAGVPRPCRRRRRNGAARPSPANELAALESRSANAAHRPPPSSSASSDLAAGGDATPRASHDDVMRRARELRERQRESVPTDWDRG